MEKVFFDIGIFFKLKFAHRGREQMANRTIEKRAKNSQHGTKPFPFENLSPMRSIICLLFIMLFLQACATTIYTTLESNPRGAFIYGGENPSDMKYIGLTPHTTKYTGFDPYWKACYYQFRMVDGYYDSQILYYPRSATNANRNVYAELLKIPKKVESKEEPDDKSVVPKSKSDTETTPPEGNKTQDAEPKNKRIIEKSKSGTGFFINTKGYFISNEHVVKDCKNIDVVNSTMKSRAQVIFSDQKNDIAVLKIDGNPVLYSAYFRIGKSIRAGDDIISVGFPLGSVLGSDLKVTKGNISSMTGIGNDTSMLQFSAPIQPGNSGGPLLDNSGNIVGLVSGKLSDMGILKATGSLPQNVNFAIKNQVVQTFLDSHGIEYLTRSSDKNIGAAEVVEQAKKYTFNVQCFEY
jgi:S1-C subfamily serine protease